MTDPHYKRGTIRKDGKLYGRYPDGSLYRIYSTTDRPFLQLVNRDGETFLRIRHATELGYTDCPCPGVADLSYPSSALRRSRTVGKGLVNYRPRKRIANAVTTMVGGGIADRRDGLGNTTPHIVYRFE